MLGRKTWLPLRLSLDPKGVRLGLVEFCVRFEFGVILGFEFGFNCCNHDTRLWHESNPLQNNACMTMLYIQEVCWQLGVSSTNHRMHRFFPCYFASQTSAQSLLLPFLPLICLSTGCHGGSRMNTIPPFGTCPSCFLLCLLLSLSVSSCFQVSSLIMFSNSHDDLHMFLSVIMFVHVWTCPMPTICFGWPLRLFLWAPMWQAGLIYDHLRSHYSLGFRSLHLIFNNRLNASRLTLPSPFPAILTVVIFRLPVFPSHSGSTCN